MAIAPPRGSAFANPSLCSVASLTALRMFAPQSRAAKPFLGVGNPLLNGDGSSSEQERAERARTQQRCPNTPHVDSGGGTMARRLRLTGPLFRSGQIADVGTIRALLPLPETRDELCAVARALGVKDPNTCCSVHGQQRRPSRP